MCVEEARGAQAVERLPGRDQVDPADANAHVLLLPLAVVRGGHAGAIRLALVGRLLAVGAVAAQSCGTKRTEKKSQGVRGLRESDAGQTETETVFVIGICIKMKLRCDGSVQNRNRDGVLDRNLAQDWRGTKERINDCIVQEREDF